MRRSRYLRTEEVVLGNTGSRFVHESKISSITIDILNYAGMSVLRGLGGVSGEA